MNTSRPTDWVELAKRAADGLEVVLLWDRSRNRLKIAVSDESGSATTSTSRSLGRRR